jgi:hypothetical protein
VWEQDFGGESKDSHNQAEEEFKNILEGNKLRLAAKPQVYIKPAQSKKAITMVKGKGKFHKNGNQERYSEAAGDPVYEGPIRYVPKDDTRVETVIFMSTATNTATGSAGSMAALMTDDIINAAPPLWSTISATYSQFRVVAIEMEFHPGWEGTAIANATFAMNNVIPWYTCVDRGTTLTTQATPSTALVHVDSVKLHPINRSWRRVARSIGMPELQWIQTTSSTSVATYAIKAACDSTATGSVNTGDIIRIWRVEFMGRGP